MKHLFFLFVLVLVGAAGWRIGGELSSDAFGMAVGICFGVMASIPVGLMLLASEKRRDGHSSHQQQPQRQIEQQPPAQQIHIKELHLHMHSAPGRSRQAEVMQRHQIAGPMPETPAPRTFRIVGDLEDR